MTRLIIVGCGGFGRETFELVRALNQAGSKVEVVGWADDDPDRHGAELLGRPVLGPAEVVLDHDAYVVVTTGHPGNYWSRYEITERLDLDDDRYATLVHPTAVIPQSVTLGPGTVVHAGVVATVDVHIGRHVVVMPQVVFTHDDVVGGFATFGAGARIAGRVTVERGAYVGSGAMIREDVTVGAWSLVGMGAVVTDDVPRGEVWAGVPARFLRTADGVPNG